MNAKLLYIIRIYFSYTLVFVFMKPVFMLYNHSEYAANFKDYFEVITHGLPLDLSTAGYLTALPLLITLLSTWLTIPFQNRILQIYYGITALLLSIILCTDCALYSFWQFKLDATVFNYINSPKDMIASVSIGYLLLGLLFVLIFAAAVFWLLHTARIPATKKRCNRWLTSGIIVLLGGVLFLLVRGGVGKSTMNIGVAYYSGTQFLNHAAVNPAFNLLASISKTKHFDKLYRFYHPEECQKLFAQLQYHNQSDDPEALLNTNRPNVIVIILEGFAATFIEPLGGVKDATPEFNKLSHEGIFFTQCNANSFRTDRGVVCALSGYPSFPQMSVMKIPEKSRTMPSLARSFAAAGYHTDFLYGGDINFTNMKSYLLSTGYQTALGDTHFPVSVRRTHAWGVTDVIAFDTLYNRTLAHSKDKPWFTTFLSLASHEPWIVPYNRIKNDIRANGMAYTDHCLGLFIQKLKKTPIWKNLLVICIADHGISYPKGLTEADRRRYRIPMLWLGGAVKTPRIFNKLCNQTDLPATLLGQLGINHRQYTFSRDVMSKNYTYPFAIHTFDNGFAFVDSTGYTVQDFNSKRVLTDLPHPSERRLRLGHAILQTTVNDFAKR
jgi:phosphoglycerol transferase MdoB-like AlkP superfamily enzyme